MVVRVERPDLVRSVQEVHPNSLSQYLLCFMREAVQLVTSPHFLQAGGGGTCGGHTSLGWKYIVLEGAERAGALICLGREGGFTAVCSFSMWILRSFAFLKHI